MSPAPTRRSGLTLMELMVVLFVLVALAALVVPLVGTGVSSAEIDITFQTMQRLRDAIMGGNGSNAGYFADMKGLTIPLRDPHGLPMPPDPMNPNLASLADLLRKPTGAQDYNVQTQRGWRGPYITQGLSGSLLEVRDSFPNAAGQPGSPIVIQWPRADSGIATSRWPEYVRIVSFGANGTAGVAANLAAGPGLWNPIQINAANWDDDIILYVRRDLSGMDWTNYWELKKAMGN